MIDPEKTWIDTVNKIPPTKGDDGLQKQVDAVAAATSTKAQLTGLTGQVTFTFEKAVFFDGLKKLAPSDNPAEGALKTATAWGQAITASKMIVAPGAVFGAPTPATTFSIVATTTLDPPSLAKAQQQLQAELLEGNKSPTGDPEKAKIGPALMKAFLALTYTVSGTNSVAPTPAPLVAPTLALM